MRCRRRSFTVKDEGMNYSSDPVPIGAPIVTIKGTLVDTVARMVRKRCHIRRVETAPTRPLALTKVGTHATVGSMKARPICVQNDCCEHRNTLDAGREGQRREPPNVVAVSDEYSIDIPSLDAPMWKGQDTYIRNAYGMASCDMVCFEEARV